MSLASACASISPLCWASAQLGCQVVNAVIDPGVKVLPAHHRASGECEPAFVGLQVQPCGSETMEKARRRSWLSPSIGYHWKAMDPLSIEVIEQYALREPPADEIQRVEEHIAACPDCEEWLQDEVELPTATRSSSVAEVRRIVESGRKNAAKQ
jgi:hypothetical protein